MMQLLTANAVAIWKATLAEIFLILCAVFLCRNQSKYERKKSYQKKIRATSRIKFEDYIFRNSGFSGPSVTLVLRAIQGWLAKNLLM